MIMMPNIATCLLEPNIYSRMCTGNPRPTKHEQGIGGKLFWAAHKSQDKIPRTKERKRLGGISVPLSFHIADYFVSKALPII